jgi:hypothetical protein
MQAAVKAMIRLRFTPVASPPSVRCDRRLNAGSIDKIREKYRNATLAQIGASGAVARERRQRRGGTEISRLDGIG